MVKSSFSLIQGPLLLQLLRYGKTLHKPLMRNFRFFLALRSPFHLQELDQGKI